MNLLNVLEGGVGSVNWVFIHGWGSDNTLWDDFRKQLKFMLPVEFSGPHFAVNLPGFGVDTSVSPLSLEDYLAELKRVLPENCMLVGWSLGGMVASQLALRNPEKIKALITLASNPCFVAREDWPWAMDENIFDQFFKDFKLSPLKTWSKFCSLQAMGAEEPKYLLKTLKSQRPPCELTQDAWLQGLQWLRFIDNRSLLAELQCPQLHVLGEGDSLLPESACAPMRELGCAQVELIKASGHCMHLSQTQSTIAVVKTWLLTQVDHGTKQGKIFFKEPAIVEPIDKAKIARSFGLKAHSYDAAAKLQRSVAVDLLDHAANKNIKLSDHDALILDMGCGTGYVSELLLQNAIKSFSITQKNIILLDIAEPMVRFARQKHRVSGVTADAERLPLINQSFECIFSNLALQWCSDLKRVGEAAKRILVEDGWFVFSTLGPETLVELKNSWAKVNGFQHVNSFKSVADIIAEIEQSGMVIEEIVQSKKMMWYSSVLPILRDLKAIGAHNMNAAQNPGLTPLRHMKALEQAYEDYRDVNGKLAVTYDVISVFAQNKA